MPPEQFVRALVPRSAFTSTSGLRVRSGTGLDRIAAEERQDARAYERERRRLDDALANLGRTLLLLLALAVLPAAAVLARRLRPVWTRAADRVRPRVRAGTAW